MMSSVSETHTYRGQHSEVNFFLDDYETLKVTIDTERLHLESATLSERCYNPFVRLFGDEKVIEKFATGKTKTEKEVLDRIATWVGRWQKKDPYSGMAVFKNDTDELLGHVVLGHGDAPGQSELAGLGFSNHWNQGFGKEASAAVVKDYAPATVAEGYTLEDKTLERITATARPDNPASLHLLEHLGMHKAAEEVKFEALRSHFYIDLSELPKAQRV